VTLSRTDASHQLDGAGLRAKRALGQNFVVDANTVRRIARLAGVEGHPHVLEIGAGLGSLTMALSEIAGHVTASKSMKPCSRFSTKMSANWRTSPLFMPMRCSSIGPHCSATPPTG